MPRFICYAGAHRLPQIRLRRRLLLAAVHAGLLLVCELRFARAELAPAAACLRAAALLVLACGVCLALELPRRRAFLRSRAAPRPQ